MSEKANHATDARSPDTERKVMSKEQMAAYPRWQLSSFDQLGGAGKKAKDSFAESSELQSLQRIAHDTGYAAGHTAGHSAGLAAGYAAGVQQAQAEAQQINFLMQNLQQGLNQTDQELAQSLLDLALSVANKMVRESLQIKPEVILDIIHEAISILPQFNQNAHLILHPDDAELVRKHINDELTHAGWKIFTDAKIERGGCLIKTSNSLIEATNAARWQRIVDSIGQDHSWLA